jgi:creatinine amidohydrolase
MKWGDLSSVQLAQSALHTRVGLVPVGATEQHGPHLPTDTDTRVAQAISDGVSERDDSVIVLPAVTVGCSLGHGTKFPGTLSLFPEELSRLLIRYAEWSALSGLTRLIFVNGHMGNVAALAAATDRLRFQRPDLKSTWVDWWRVSPNVAAEVLKDGEDIHANRAESSIMLHLWPDAVNQGAMQSADDDDRTGTLTFRYTAEVLSRNGVTGRPSEASAALGKELYDEIVEAVADRIRNAATEEPPIPSRTQRNPPPNWI